MECPHCNAELEWEDSYGNKDYIIYGNQNGKMGDIYRCPNHEGFNSKEEAIEYAEMVGLEYEDWEEIVCQSSCNSISGSFYIDKQGNLYEGYPC